GSGARPRRPRPPPSRHGRRTLPLDDSGAKSETSPNTREISRAHAVRAGRVTMNAHPAPTPDEAATFVRALVEEYAESLRAGAEPDRYAFLRRRPELAALLEPQL